MIESPKNFIEQFQNFIEHIAGVMKTFLTKEVADNYYLGKSEKASSASLADTATKATQDANGNVIPETYATKSELTSGLATKQPVGDYRTKSELDSIYLGINAKAKSAETADKVTGLTYSEITGSPTGIKCEPPFVNGRLDFEYSAKSYVATSDVMFVSSIYASKSDSYSSGSVTVTLDGAQIGKRIIDEHGRSNDNGLVQGTLFLKKGQTLRYSGSGLDGGSVSYTTVPIKLA